MQVSPILEIWTAIFLFISKVIGYCLIWMEVADVVRLTITGTWYWASPEWLVSAHTPGIFVVNLGDNQTESSEWRQDFHLANFLLTEGKMPIFCCVSLNLCLITEKVIVAFSLC